MKKIVLFLLVAASVSNINAQKKEREAAVPPYSGSEWRGEDYVRQRIFAY